jgi:hypothetical protein
LSFCALGASLPRSQRKALPCSSKQQGEGARDKTTEAGARRCAREKAKCKLAFAHTRAQRINFFITAETKEANDAGGARESDRGGGARESDRGGGARENDRGGGARERDRGGGAKKATEAVAREKGPRRGRKESDRGGVGGSRGSPGPRLARRSDPLHHTYTARRSDHAQPLTADEFKRYRPAVVFIRL